MTDSFDDYAELVLDVVDAIPPGQVLTYGDIAELIGKGGPRQVAAVMSRGVGGPWWRVVRADGTLPERLSRRARTHYLEERTPLMPGSHRIRMSAARWTPAESPDPGLSVPDDRIEP